MSEAKALCVAVRHLTLFELDRDTNEAIWDVRTVRCQEMDEAEALPIDCVMDPNEAT